MLVSLQQAQVYLFNSVIPRMPRYFIPLSFAAFAHNSFIIIIINNYSTFAIYYFIIGLQFYYSPICQAPPPDLAPAGAGICRQSGTGGQAV